MRWRHVCWWLMLVGAALIYGGAASHLKGLPRAVAVEDMQVSTPIPVQLLLAGGDRFLAANIAVFRALMLRTDRAQEAAIPVLAKVQRDAAWLNPGHADNYYTAAAILAWQGQTNSAKYVLVRAIPARPGDLMPSYFHAFNLFHFAKQPREGAQVLLAAAARSSNEEEQLSLRDLAARWLNREPDARAAILLIKKMAEQSRHVGFKRYLEARAARMEGLEQLRDAHARFIAAFGRQPASLDELVKRKMIARIPQDPLKLGYALSPNGEPIYQRRIPAAQ